MSDIAGEVGRIAEACESPTLRLLNQKWAPFVLAVFRSSFSRQTKQVKAERLHARVDAYLHELESLGYDTPPQAQGRALCIAWMNDQWIKRVPAEDDGGEAYELTSHTLAAQRVIEGLSRERALLSESRLTTILDAGRRWAVDANADREARIATLDGDIARLTAERDRLAGGGELLSASDDRMLNGYIDMVDLLGQLPGDFRRVEEALDSIHRKMIRDFRAEERPKGEVLDAYLTASDHLTSQTEEGRAFEGALTILNDEELLAGFQEDLRAIMAHPFAEALRTDEKRDFLKAASILRQGLYDVQSQQHKASRSLAEHLASHDSVDERELTKVLRQLQQEMSIWMEGARPRDYVPMKWMPAKLEIEHLRTRFYDPAIERPVPPLEDVSGGAPEPVSLEEIRRYGGPMLDQVRSRVVEALRSGCGTLGSAFNELEDSLRRPVEVFGLLQLATDIGIMDGQAAETEIVDTIRPDGTRRRWLIPRLAARAEQVQGARGERNE
ncbi:DUF3375 domain-containing protein [Sinomonas sp. P47F7]|uniref:DUF3375 domain-containing protein n=1 Tax=Sinomonas sp. P47F7 TaxID=3410987 RepID=UPI003BF5B653